MEGHEKDELIVKDRWDEIYRKRDVFPDVDENIPGIIKLFEERGMKRILDLGCGAGRHTVYLAERGFEVYGIDIAGEGVKKAEILLKEKGLHAKVRVGSISKLPYEDHFFDGVISVRVIHHGRIDAVRKTIEEIERVLKPGGLVFVAVRKRVKKSERRPFKEVGPRTYVPIDGGEKDIVHYLFTKELLGKEFKHFRILRLWVDKSKYYCLLGELKVTAK